MADRQGLKKKKGAGGKAGSKGKGSKASGKASAGGKAGGKAGAAGKGTDGKQVKEEGEGGAAGKKKRKDLTVRGRATQGGACSSSPLPPVPARVTVHATPWLPTYHHTHSLPIFPSPLPPAGCLPSGGALPRVHLC